MRTVNCAGSLVFAIVLSAAVALVVWGVVQIAGALHG